MDFSKFSGPNINSWSFLFQPTYTLSCSWLWMQKQKVSKGHKTLSKPSLEMCVDKPNVSAASEKVTTCCCKYCSKPLLLMLMFVCQWNDVYLEPEFRHIEGLNWEIVVKVSNEAEKCHDGSHIPSFWSVGLLIIHQDTDFLLVICHVWSFSAFFLT